jgi:hypothetical protein
MILSRLRYRPVTVPLQFMGLRYRPLPFLNQRYPRLPCVTDRDTSVTKRYRTLHALPNVTSVTYGIYGFWRIFKLKKLLNMFANNLLFYSNKFPI